QNEQCSIGRAGEQNLERAALQDRVELVPMEHQQPAAGAGRMHGSALNLDVAETDADERAQVLVVVAGNVDYARPLLALLQEQAQRFSVGLGPVERAPETLEVDDVADEVERVAARPAQEIEQ